VRSLVSGGRTKSPSRLSLMRTITNYSPTISLLTSPIHDMRTSFLITVSIVVLTAFASPANVHYVVHEKRDVEISDWIPKAIEVDRSIIIPLSIALTQRNLEKGQDFLMDVSDPFSPNYGKHWTAQKVISMIFKVPLADCQRSLRLLPRHIRQSWRSNRGLWIAA
jgi:hypothetical protein